MFELNCRLPANVTAQVTSDRDLELDRGSEMLLDAYLPGLERTPAIQGRPDIAIRHEESTSFALEQAGTHVLLRDAWGGTISPDLYHLFYAASRVKLMEHGLYSVHAASVGRDEQILVVGHSGSGKTTTALDLVREHAFKIASGNKTVVAFDPRTGMSVRAGTSTMTVRDGDGERYAAPLGKETVAYGNRLAFVLDDSHYVAVSEQRIAGIVLVRLHDGLKDAKELSGLSALHTLYPYFMDSVNADTVVGGGKGVFAGDPPPGARESLSRGLQASISSIPVYSVAGPLPFVVSTVAEMARANGAA